MTRISTVSPAPPLPATIPLSGPVYLIALDPTYRESMQPLSLHEEYYPALNKGDLSAEGVRQQLQGEYMERARVQRDDHG